MQLFNVQREITFEVTPEAANRIKTLASKHGKPNAGLRIRILAGGCAGLQYKFEFADTPAKDDNVIEQHGVKVYVDPKSGLFLMGSKLDYVEDLMKSGFQISNPNATGKCSCGESFTA